MTTTTTTITTEAELDALPVGSVVLDRHEYPWRKGCGSWVCTSDGGVIEPIKVTPLTVLHVPGQPAPTEHAAERIDGHWLVEEHDGHTCGAGGEHGHEPGCGLVPLVDLRGLPGWDSLVQLVLAEAAGLTAECGNPARHEAHNFQNGGPEDGDWCKGAAPTVKPSQTELAGTIWRTSHADEGTISATGADIIADAVLPLLPGRTEAQVKVEALREAAAELVRAPLVEYHQPTVWLHARAAGIEFADAVERGEGRG